MPFLLVLLVNSLLVIGAILFHYEVLYHLAKRLASIHHFAPRIRVLFGVIIIFLAHVIEIWLFGLGYFFTLKLDGLGKLVGSVSDGGSLLDCVYLSFLTFTTVGYGDVVGEGYVRYLTGVEALTGLILITWSASFIYLEMQKFWNQPRGADNP